MPSLLQSEARATTSTSNPRQPVLATVSIGSLELHNRAAVAPMSRVSATATGRPTAEMGRYYGRFSEGGFGLVISEGLYTDCLHSRGYSNQPGIVTERQVAAWRDVVYEVHQGGARFVAQLMHAGALSQAPAHASLDPAFEVIGPSAVQPRGQMMPEYGGEGPYRTPREMTSAEIRQVTQGFVSAARNAKRAGFDGVEIHAANGYLLDQFLTSYTNRRTDRYGGGVENRIRLTSEIVHAVRAAVPSDFVVGVRLSQTKVNDFEYRWSESDAREIFTAVGRSGVSYIHIASEGRDWLSTATLARGVTTTGLARELTGLPVIGNGGMDDPERAAQVIEGGHADIVSLGRGALANTDWPRRLERGRPIEKFHAEILSPEATLANAERIFRRQDPNHYITQQRSNES